MMVVQEDSLIWGEEDVTSLKDKGDENFPVGSLLIAPSLRPVIHAYYRFARVADDVVDNQILNSEQKLARLNGLKSVLLGQLEAPKNRADGQSAALLRVALLDYEVPFEVASDLLVAFSMDAKKNRYENWEELEEYCRYSANPVGRFLLTLHHESEESFPYSDALCTSLQIINHLQDAASDLKNLDRCYIPLTWLSNEGIGVEALLEPKMSPALRRVFNRVLDRVTVLNHHSMALMPLISYRRMRLEAAVIVGLCKRLTKRLYLQDALAERVKLSKKDVMFSLLAALRYFG